MTKEPGLRELRLIIKELRAEVERLTLAIAIKCRPGPQAMSRTAADIEREGALSNTETSRAVIIELRTEVARLTEAHERIVNWSRAYPLTVFPKPDLKRARELLEAGGMTLDAISADAMRHVIKQVAEISRAALDPTP